MCIKKQNLILRRVYFIIQTNPFFYLPESSLKGHLSIADLLMIMPWCLETGNEKGV